MDKAVRDITGEMRWRNANKASFMDNKRSSDVQRPTLEAKTGLEDSMV